MSVKKFPYDLNASTPLLRTSLRPRLATDAKRLGIIDSAWHKLPFSGIQAGFPCSRSREGRILCPEGETASEDGVRDAVSSVCQSPLIVRNTARSRRLQKRPWCWCSGHAFRM